MHHRGAAAALLRATDQLALTGPQSAMMHTLERQLRASRQSVHDAFRTMRDDLAAQVRTGVIDPATVQADESLVANALGAHQAREIDALNALHGLLGPEERAAVANAVRLEQPGRAEEQARPRPEEEGTTARLERLTRDLALDAEQQQRVAALLSAQPTPGPTYRAEYRERFDAVLNAFPTDTFDAMTTVQGAAASSAAMVRGHIEGKVAFLSQLLPILRPDQRDKLASSIELHDSATDHSATDHERCD
jgi:Spy/CpxP family protein refolding chaperone